MDGWERFSETLLPEKEELYSNLTIESITDGDHKHAKSALEDFRLQNLGQYHDVHIPNDSLLRPEISETSA